MAGARTVAGAVCAVVGVVALAGAWSPVIGQSASHEEIELLQSASQLEARGELDAAEQRLREALEARLSSVPVLLALERVLRIQGRFEDLPPLVEAALEDDPASTLLNQLLVRSYAELERGEDLEAAAERWIASVPRLEVPYREIARAWSSRGEYGRAREVLEEGRRRIGGDHTLALELGDVYAELREPGLAVREWARSIDREGRGLNPVRRRVRSLPDGGESVVAELVELLAGDAAAAGRVDAALELAVEAGLEARARALVEARLPALDPGERRRMLERVARTADGGGHRALAHWAYGRLVAMDRGRAEMDGRAQAYRTRHAELALELDDGPAPGTSQDGAGGALAPGSVQRRQAAATRVELLAAQDPDAAARSLRAFRSEHPQAPESDRLTATVAASLLARGGADAAQAILADADGPLSGVVRGRLLLLRGDMAAAREAFMVAAPGLRGVEATAALSLVTLLGRVSTEAGRMIGEALALRDQGEPGAAVDLVRAGADRLQPEDRPALLDFVAGLAAEGGLPGEARAVRRLLVAEHPRSAEAPGALLALARDLTAEDGGHAEARELLERLIIEYPRSALVPQARRALDRLGRRDVVGGTG